MNCPRRDPGQASGAATARAPRNTTRACAVVQRHDSVCRQRERLVLTAVEGVAQGPGRSRIAVCSVGWYRRHWSCRCPRQVQRQIRLAAAGRSRRTRPPSWKAHASRADDRHCTAEAGTDAASTWTTCFGDSARCRPKSCGPDERATRPRPAARRCPRAHAWQACATRPELVAGAGPVSLNTLKVVQSMNRTPTRYRSRAQRVMACATRQEQQPVRQPGEARRGRRGVVAPLQLQAFGDVAQGQHEAADGTNRAVPEGAPRPGCSTVGVQHAPVGDAARYTAIHTSQQHRAGPRPPLWMDGPRQVDAGEDSKPSIGRRTGGVDARCRTRPGSDQVRGVV